MIYGHGVEETSTVRHYLEQYVKRSVANLGIQGGYMHREYQIFKHFGVSLRPQYVFLFFLMNDLQDVIGEWVELEGEDPSKFLSTPITDHTAPYFEVIPLSESWSQKVKFFLGEVYVFKAYGFFREYLKKPLPKEQNDLDVEQLKPLAIRDNDVSGNSWQSLPLFRERPELIPAMQFHLHGLLKMQDLAQRNHIQFVNVFIHTGYGQEEPIYEIILRNFCQEHNITFFNLRQGFELAIEEGQELFLQGDGHFSDTGAQLAAELIYDEFFRHEEVR
jgi:hypothetical protein